MNYGSFTAPHLVLCYCNAPRESWQAAVCILGKDLRDLLETESPEFQTANCIFSYFSLWISLVGNAGYSPKVSKRIWRAWEWQGKAERDGLIRNIFETSDPKAVPVTQPPWTELAPGMAADTMLMWHCKHAFHLE